MIRNAFIFMEYQIHVLADLPTRYVTDRNYDEK